MTSTKPSLEEVTGFLGVGALLMLGLFFLIDGPTNFWETVEHYAKTSSFAILFSVPLLVIAYVLGLLLSLAGQALLERFVHPILGPELFTSAAQKGREPLLNRYLEVERHSRLLYGCSSAFLLLAIGSLAVQHYLPQKQQVVAVICFVLGLVLSASCPLLARYLQRQVAEYVRTCELRSTGSSDA